MDEGETSWIRRTKFSHTVCHRLDSSKSSISFERYSSGLKSRPQTNPIKSPVVRNPITNKQRSLSPLAQSKLSEAFKEAKTNQRRFSTPHPRSRELEKIVKGKAKETKAKEIKQAASYKSPLRHLGTMKISEKTKSKKDGWTKLFDHGGGRVNAEEVANGPVVDMSKLLVGVRFAHGLYSRLYRGIYNDESVAVKVISIPDDDENGVLAGKLEKQFNREATLLSRLHHPNIIKFIAAYKAPGVFCIITEYLSEGSLRAFLHKLEHKTLPLQKLVAISLDIARGMEFIHSQGVIHRDLKPENVLVDEDFHLKIADFGIACEEAYCDLLADDPGTYRWMAPEMIKRKSYGRKVDVYSFGLVLWEMVAGTVPYEDMNPIQAAFAVVHKNLRPTIPVGCPPAMRALIEQCWALKPDKRPEFWQIVKVLEEFESSLARVGTLDFVQNPIFQDHKKGLHNWIRRLGPIYHSPSPSMPKPHHSPSPSMPKPHHSPSPSMPKLHHSPSPSMPKLHHSASMPKPHHSPSPSMPKPKFT